MARTCSALYEPSMNVLWHTLYDMSPVLKCLPPNLWYEEDKQYSLSADTQGPEGGTVHNLVSVRLVLLRVILEVNPG